MHIVRVCAGGASPAPLADARRIGHTCVRLTRVYLYARRTIAYVLADIAQRAGAGNSPYVMMGYM